MASVTSAIVKSILDSSTADSSTDGLISAIIDNSAEPIADVPAAEIPVTNSFDSIEYKLINGIKVYTGATASMRERHQRNIEYLKNLVPDNEKLFTVLEPSTITAQGLMSNVQFDEREVISMLSTPKGAIMHIGCNFGELFNENYKVPEVVRKSGRGRKPKPKIKPKRKTQGSGKYFSSQITFLIRHPENKIEYKIKLFRNGVFQVPGVKDPSMCDLVAPITILRDYLSYNFGDDVQVMNFMAVMRNYKARLIDTRLHVDLEELERYINKIKKVSNLKDFYRYLLSPIPSNLRNKAMKYIGKTNVMNIAEIAYNTDRCFCLIIKFYRPMPIDIYKKTTVKLLKRGKINFDGGNSEYEIEELYHWLQYIYYLKKKDVLVDVSQIQNNYIPEEVLSLNPDLFIYDESDADSDANEDCKEDCEQTDVEEVEEVEEVEGCNIVGTQTSPEDAKDIKDAKLIKTVDGVQYMDVGGVSGVDDPRWRTYRRVNFNSEESDKQDGNLILNTLVK